MAIAVECEHCGQRYSVREDLLGKRMKCKACGQATSIVAAPARSKRPAEALAAVQGAPAASTPGPVPNTAVPAKAKSAAPAALKPARTPARPGVPNTQKAPAPARPGAASDLVAPQGPPLPAPEPNLLDLLDDSAFPAAANAPLSSGVVLKAGAPAAVAKPKAQKKRKKKKSVSDGPSDNVQVLRRMASGAFLVLMGLIAIGRAIYAIVTKDDDSGTIGFLVGRWIIGGVGSISAGVKLICG